MVTFKMDYFSGIWHNFTLHDVEDYYKLRGCLFSDFFENGYETSIGSEAWFCYIQSGVKIFIPSADFACCPIEIRTSPELYNYQFPRIKIDFSGQGLDWYREKLGGQCIEDILRKPHASFRPTRCDIAVDCYNQFDKVFGELKDYLSKLALKGHRRVCCQGLRGGVKYDLKLGEQSTIYLGGTSGDMLLRIYDKKLELTDMYGSWRVEPPRLPDDESIESWTRYELQCRREAAFCMLYHPVLGDDKKPVFDNGCPICQDEDVAVWMISNVKTLFSRYAFRNMEKSVDHKQAEILPFWQVLLSYFVEKVPIIQISHFVQFKPSIDKAKKQLEKTANAANFFAAVYGVRELLRFFENCLIQNQRQRKSKNFTESLNASFRHNAFLVYLQSFSSDLNDFVGLKSINGEIRYNYDLLGDYNGNTKKLLSDAES